jgi:hypothetical protein
MLHHRQGESAGEESPPPPVAKNSEAHELCRLSLPDFILQHSAEPRDAYISQRASGVPDSMFQNEILRAYIEHVHPFLPVVDLADFISAALQQSLETEAQNSVVLQAAMVAAAPFVDMQLLASRGFASHKEVQITFYERAKILYRRKMESPRLSLVQAALLLSAGVGTKEAGAWLRLATSYGRALGLQCDLDEPAEEARYRKLKKRIWWTCYMRSCVHGISIGAPLPMDYTDEHPAALHIDDLDLEPLPADVLSQFQITTDRDPSSEDRMVAHAYVEFVHCCYLLGQHLVERSRSNKAQSSHVSEPYDCTEVLKYDLALEDWFHGLPETLKCVDVDSWKFLDQQGSGAVRIYSSLLMGMYLASHIVLHSPQARASCRDVDPEIRELAQSRISRSAVLITEIFRALSRNGDTAILPDIATPLLRLSCVIHLSYRRSLCSVTRLGSCDRLEACMAVLYQLRGMHITADSLYRELRSMLMRGSVETLSYGTERSGLSSR